MSDIETSFDPFHLFDLPYEFNLDEKQLQNQYYKLQSMAHPDQQRLNPKNQLVSSSEINEAYGILKNPVTRGTFLLKRHGIKIEDLSSEILLDLMDIQEKIATCPSKEYDKFMKKIEDYIQSSFETLNNSFQLNAWHNAQKALGKLTYLNKIQQQLKQKIYDSFTNSGTPSAHC